MTDRNHTLTNEKIKRHGRTLYRIRHADGREGGWAETLDSIPPDSTAAFYGDALCFKGGEFRGGEFRGGVFDGGVFDGGVFYGGVFYGGTFHDGEFWGGLFYGGEFRGGKFWGGLFYGGAFHGGVFRGGVFYTSPCCAQRSDGYMFVAKYVDDDLRIWAGCRNFSWDRAVAHWNDDHPYGAESQRIIHFLKAQAEAERERDAKREKTND
jgi:hypothetical protein